MVFPLEGNREQPPASSLLRVRLGKNNGNTIVLDMFDEDLPDEMLLLLDGSGIGQWS